MRKHAAHTLFFAVVGLSLLLSFSYAYLSYYSQKMSLLTQFTAHQKAALVYQTARPIYETKDSMQVQLTTNLGVAEFQRQADHVYCQVKLKDTNYEETFQYVAEQTSKN